jgi:hypothetical protein
MPQRGQARAGGQAHIPGTDHRDPTHEHTPLPSRCVESHAVVNPVLAHRNRIRPESTSGAVSWAAVSSSGRSRPAGAVRGPGDGGLSGATLVGARQRSSSTA